MPISLLFPEALDHEVDWTFSEFIKPLVDSVASRNWESLKLNVRSQDSETVDDIIRAGPCKPMDSFERNLSH